MSPNMDQYSRTVSAVGQAVSTGDLRRAYELANWAINQGMTGRILFNARALAYQASGRFDDALADFRSALELVPGDAATNAAIGTVLAAQDKLTEAIAAFDLAIAVNPNEPMVQYRRASALVRKDLYDSAEQGFLSAIALKPDFADALAEYASVVARREKYDIAHEFAERALALSPGHPLAHYAMALIERSKKQYSEVEQRLRFLVFHRSLDSQTRGGMCSLLGDALEAQGRHEEAFETYRRGNQFLQEENSARFKDGRGLDAIRNLTAYFKSAPAAKWKAAQPAGRPSGGPSQHVFLLGFMRSGTTLLETVLASNPEVVALEEKMALSPLSDTYMRSTEELDALCDIQGSALEAARAGYWDRVREHAPDIRGKVLVDKQPLNTTRLPLIAKLFPDAKVLFALRDPRDVVFSCYRRPLKINVMMYEFLGLEDAARMYAAIMNLGEIYREKLTLNLFEHHYEDMVADFEGRVRAVCEFIGIEWSESMRDFNKHVSQVNINSPSATQVRRPLYGEGIGHWRKYAQQLQPIMPILKPWVERYGYTAE